MLAAVTVGESMASPSCTARTAVTTVTGVTHIRAAYAGFLDGVDTRDDVGPLG